MSDVVERVWPLAERVTQAEGFGLVDAEFTRDHRNWVLRIFIEREDGGVSLGDCARISGRLSALLDVHDVTPNAYRLEVSSPGADRPLRRPEDFERFSGEKVRVKTFAKIDGRKRFSGVLRGLEGDDVLIELEGQEQPVKIPLTSISKANLEFDFSSVLSGNRS